MPNVVELLSERGFLEALTAQEIRKLVEKPIKVYCGFDPSADSLHLGNMVAIMGLAWFQRCGHTAVPVIGGATGMIGDPSGKSKERKLLDETTLQKNVSGIRKNLETIIDFNNQESAPLLLNNFDWLKSFSMIQFLRDVGKFFRIGPMLGKESVRQRLSAEEGLSYTEFSYQLLQAYDFLYLYNHHGVRVQIGGSDQWGNITAGIDLIRKVNGGQAYGLTFPLLTTSDGKKFGKTEKGAIWLSPEKLSPYEFYQHLFRISDTDVIGFLRLLTFMDMGDINAIEHQMKQPEYIPNTAQKILAEQVTLLIHGEQGLQAALKVTEAAKPGSKAILNAQALEGIASQMPSCTLKLSEVIETKLIDILVRTNLLDSKGKGRRLIKNGGVYMNNRQINDQDCTICRKDLIEGRLLLLAAGKKKKILLRVYEDQPV